jgi:undecaprenyl diphosphate synthase
LKKDSTGTPTIPSTPRHIAIIMDGNGRWGEQHGLSRLEGHRAGVKNIRSIIKALHTNEVQYVTLYAFSTENWNRPEDEVTGIFKILEEFILPEATELHKNGVRIRHIGSMDGLSATVKASINGVLKMTEKNTGMTLGVALNYGGRAEIINAVRRITADGVPPEDITKESFQKYLYAPDFPDVDMVIRTGGEMRISNLLIWQTAYSEYYFTPVLWPDFSEKELEKALQAYSQRQRRFGGVRAKKHA